MSTDFPEIGWLPPFRFHRRPVPMPPDLRPIWKMITLCLILSRCRGKRAPVTKLHVLSWCLKSSRAQRRLIDFLDGSRPPEDVVIHLEPSVNRAVAFGLADGLFQVDKGKVFLTPKGEVVARQVAQLDDVLVPERAFLEAAASRLTDKELRRVTGTRGSDGS